MSRHLRIQVDDEHGTAVVFIDKAPTQQQLDSVAKVIDRLDIDQHTAWQMLPVLVRRVADEQAYERICADRGLLV